MTRGKKYATDEERVAALKAAKKAYRERNPNRDHEYYLKNKEKINEGNRERYQRDIVSRRAYTRKRSIEGRANKANWVMSRGGKCEICGYELSLWNVDAFEAHHRNPEEKSFMIRWPIAHRKEQQEELKKCIAVCCNCHNIIHWNLMETEDE